jgi:hypothetical protein
MWASTQVISATSFSSQSFSGQWSTAVSSTLPKVRINAAAAVNNRYGLAEWTHQDQRFKMEDEEKTAEKPLCPKSPSSPALYPAQT